MSLSKGKILTNQEKKIKNKKLQNIRNSNIDIKVYEEDSYLEVVIYIDTIIEPAPRPRTASVFKTDEKGNKIMVGSRIYDPLAYYKDYLKKFFNSNIINNHKFKDYKFPFDGYIEVELEFTKVPPKSWSIKKKYYALKGSQKYVSKPDLDNAEKTLYDCLNEILFKDDSQIIESHSIKYYAYKDSTKATFKLYNMKIPEGRLSKEDMEEWKDLENYLEYGKEEE